MTAYLGVHVNDDVVLLTWRLASGGDKEGSADWLEAAEEISPSLSQADPANSIHRPCRDVKTRQGAACVKELEGSKA